MLLFAHLGIVVDGRDEDKITWSHLLFLESDRQRVILVSLIPAVQLEAKVFAQVVHNLTHESTAVKIQWCSVMLLARLPIAGRVRHTKVLFRRLDKLHAQLLFKVWVAPILQRLFSHIVAVPDVLLFSVVEALEMRLKRYFFV